MKRLLSIVIVLVFALTVVMPLTAEKSYAAFSERTTMPEFGSAEGQAYYYSNNNLFYQYDLGPNQKYLSSYGGYCVGNCTWYAYGRASEILGKTFNTNFRKGAAQWWDINKNGNYYPYGSTPKAGAIACYSNHVAIVEKVVNGQPYVSESGWKIASTPPASAADLRFHYGSPWEKNPKGYIYITDTASAGGAEGTVPASYSVKITAKDLNMRTGPGTNYSKIGYVKQGTYQVDQECGNWARLADSGYWICLSYATKVDTAAPPVSDTGTASSYQVKVTATNLNMRTGPSTSYQKKGYIKPGVYTIALTNNGWGKVSETGYWICLKYTTTVSGSSSAQQPGSSGGTSGSTEPSALYKVKVTASALYMRTGPGTSYSSKGKLAKGAVQEIKDTKNGWGQLSSNGYWIKLSYTVPLQGEYNVKVTAKDLNMRTGPGTSYQKKGYIKPGVHTISQTSGGWGKLKSNGYWIKLSYTTKL